MVANWEVKIAETTAQLAEANETTDRDVVRSVLDVRALCLALPAAHTHTCAHTHAHCRR